MQYWSKIICFAMDVHSLFSFFTGITIPNISWWEDCVLCLVQNGLLVCTRTACWSQILGVTELRIHCRLWLSRPLCIPFAHSTWLGLFISTRTLKQVHMSENELAKHVFLKCMTLFIYPPNIHGEHTHTLIHEKITNVWYAARYNYDKHVTMNSSNGQPPMTARDHLWSWSTANKTN